MALLIEPREMRVLLFGLHGADGEHTEHVLGNVGVGTQICTDIEGLCEEIQEGAGAVVLTEEALTADTVQALVTSLERQPAWSDLPLIVSTIQRDLARAGFGAVASLGARANVMILERPVSIRAIVVTVQSALRARRRQYETRSLVDELGLATSRAEASSRSKDAFLATLSHELRTPLNAMLGWTRMLHSAVLPAEKRERALATIERNAVAQVQLVEDLLDASRAASGKLLVTLRPMEPFAAIGAAIETVRPAAQAKGIELQANLDPAAGAVLGDDDRLHQVFWNLLSNAIKFTPAGGHVRIGLEGLASTLRVTVRDDGIGIDPSFLPHVFQRFCQADSSIKRSQGGLGIGLSLVRDIVALHGGRVSASSDGLGRGATFTVDLPRAPANAVETPHVAPAAVESSETPFAPSAVLAGLVVLVVDDEPDAAELVADVLKASGARVLTAPSAAKGYALLASSHPDILVSDIAMAGEDGYDLIRRVRAMPADRGARIPALAVTAYARIEDRARALQAGFDMHLPKPIEPRELVVVVETLAKRVGDARHPSPDA